jgi:hypothetical protein
MLWKLLKAKQASVARPKLKFRIAGEPPIALLIGVSLEYNPTLSLAALAHNKAGSITGFVEQC